MRWSLGLLEAAGGQALAATPAYRVMAETGSESDVNVPLQVQWNADIRL